MSFAPLPAFYEKNARRYGHAHHGKWEMTPIETYTCTNCGASDRERLYALWMDQEIEKGRFSPGMSAIHFAPEAPLSRKLSRFGLFDYKTADLWMRGVDFKADMMDLPFEDQRFDFFVCSHVLEHVPNDDQAIKELYRITRCGGCGILMAPIVVGLAKTVENPGATNEADRWRLYGQNDHVRLYAHNDYTNKIRSHGFHLEELGVQHFGEEAFHRLGLKRTSILYVVSK
ncbi:MAG: class I SAM-dependent methyltransferase [Betaproteobacteria bacterium]|nr:class I SAM-dependent methyltransferase [Betaproteobacteria bacterium]